MTAVTMQSAAGDEGAETSEVDPRDTSDWENGAAAASSSSSSSGSKKKDKAGAGKSSNGDAGDFDVIFDPLEDVDMKELREGNMSLGQYAHLVPDEFLEEIRNEAGYFDKPMPHPYDHMVNEMMEMQSSARRNTNNDESNSIDPSKIDVTVKDLSQPPVILREGYDERLLQARRVAKTVKGGRQVSFRAVVVIGNNAGAVGVGVGKAKEVVEAVEKARMQAFRNMIVFPLDKNASFPHRVTGRSNAATVMMRPATQGTGLIAGGAVRVVLEAAGVQNGFGKQLGSKNHLNNARATIDGLLQLRTHEEVAKIREKTVQELFS